MVKRLLPLFFPFGKEKIEFQKEFIKEIIQYRDYRI
jgi:hypothetical protein